MQNPSLYDDDPSVGQQAPAAEPGDKEEQSSSQTFLVPKAAMSGKDLQPGEKCDIEVVRVQEDSYEAQGCEGGDDKEQEQEPPAEAPAPEEGGGMSSLME